MLRLTQASFSRGEISPLLHARTDLAAYSTGLAELKNMIVLPQGGVTRRAGISSVGQVQGTERNMKLIPFEYNTSDACLLQFTNGKLKIWAGLSAFTDVPAAEIATPYSINEVQDLRYAQSGNVMFLAHKNHKPKMLTRHSLTSWTLDDLPFHGGPFIDGSEWNADAVIYLEGAGNNRTVRSSAGIFNSQLVGTLLKLEYAVQPKTETLESVAEPLQKISNAIEVKGTLNVTTTGKWTGTVSIARSADGGNSWITIRQYKRTDIDTQGQWDFTVSETEDYIFYRVTAQHTAGSGGSDSPSPIDPDWPIYAADDEEAESEPAEVTVLASGFLKSEIYRITSVTNAYTAAITRETSRGYSFDDSYNGQVSLWSIGAWGAAQGYPAVVSMYQDRLIFASSKYQPQTIWLSRTADYADFSVSDPLSDDDAVTLTLAGSTADGIHSLLATTDLLAFTSSGEWKISGAGDAGAITPSALTAHQQTTIGSKNIQPVLADGRIILVQAQGRKAYALGYDLNTDGYTGSEISILSDHMFKGRSIVDMAYQKIPDSLLWFVLDDGSFVSCTYVPEHEVTGWARHSSKYSLYHIAAVTGTEQTEIFGVGGYSSGIYLVRLFPRFGFAPADMVKVSVNEVRTLPFESVMRTLRLTVTIKDGGSKFSNRKFIPRVIVSAINSSQAWIAPGALNDAENNWERRRRIVWADADYLTDSDVQLDNGFDEYACVQIRSEGNEPLTIAAVTPVLTGG